MNGVPVDGDVVIFGNTSGLFSIVGNAVALDFEFFERDEMERWLRETGFAIQFSLTRAPYAPEIEHQSQRTYILCKK